MKDNSLLYIVIIAAGVALYYMYQQQLASAAQVTALQAQLASQASALQQAQAALNNANGNVQSEGTTTGALTTLFQNIF